MSLVGRISELCEKKGKTLTSLERDCGFGVSSIRKWDDHAPTIPKLLKVAEELDVTVGEILGENEKPASDGDGQSEDAILFAAYKAAPENVQEAIRQLLGLK